jgi:hypothetical protein
MPVKYLALLRGINVGGNNVIKMNDLKKTFEEMGFSGVQTYIQSGNVIFYGGENNKAKLSRKIEQTLTRSTGSSRISSKDFAGFASSPYFFENSAVFSGKTSTRWVILHRSGKARYPSACRPAIFPVPIIATLIIMPYPNILTEEMEGG